MTLAINVPTFVNEMISLMMGEKDQRKFVTHHANDVRINNRVTLVFGSSLQHHMDHHTYQVLIINQSLEMEPTNIRLNYGQQMFVHYILD